MRNLSLQEKEQQIISTIICCDNIINPKISKYSEGLTILYESITGISETNTLLLENFNQVKINDFRKNKFAYLRKVNEYLNNTESLIKPLNESLNSIKSNNEINIDSFKNDLSLIINELEKNNDFNKLDLLAPEILKIKLFANKPIMVYGFDIVNNYHLQTELKDNFGFNILEIISILFDKTNKRIMFVFNNQIICYDLYSNTFDYLKNILNEDTNYLNGLDKTNYLSIIGEEINRNIIELFFNKTNLELKFQDNLFKDNSKTNELAEKAQYRNNNLFVKS